MSLNLRYASRPWFASAFAFAFTPWSWSWWSWSWFECWFWSWLWFWMWSRIWSWFCREAPEKFDKITENISIVSIKKCKSKKEKVARVKKSTWPYAERGQDDPKWGAGLKFLGWTSTPFLHSYWEKETHWKKMHRGWAAYSPFGWSTTKHCPGRVRINT